MTIVNFKVSDLIPYENNPRINDNAVDSVANSIEEFGFKVPVIVDKNNVIVAGHTRVKAAKKLGLEEVPCVVADDLTEDQIKAFRLADNKVSELADWDFSKLEEELSNVDIDMSQFGFEAEELEKELNDRKEQEEKENPYTDKINIPQYEIKGDCPNTNELVNTDKTNELVSEIKDANLPAEIEQFLILSAYRHLTFDYSKIAEYYAHADKNVQELMEKSALVIIDYNDAIKYGYVQLSNRIDELYAEDNGNDEA